MPLLTRLTQNYSLFEMDGPDTRDFLHRLTTADVRNLSPGETTSGFFLEPNGKLRAYFHLHCRAREEFLILTPHGKNEAWKTAVTAAIDHFTFGEKFTLLESTQWTIYEAVGDTSGLVDPVLFPLAPGISLFLIHARASALPKAEALEENDWQRARISALIPEVDHELTLAVNPLEIGLRAAVADQKGCYPGQEVIEKIVSLGAPAKRLVLLRGVGEAPPLGTPLNVGTAESSVEAGQITSSIATGNEGEFIALALTKKIYAKEGQLLQWDPSSAGARIERLSVYESASPPLDP